MWNKVSRTRLLGVWFAAVAGVFAVSVVAGAPITIGAGELWVVASVIPPAVMLFVWRDAPAVTAAEVLYVADASATKGVR